ncbi:hypothetical protein J6590_008096 [Homalodisca vitripennis]|nr:hypothetical protein J6590_008096 [Homalodisca vitripennis]
MKRQTGTPGLYDVASSAVAGWVTNQWAIVSLQAARIGDVDSEAGYRTQIYKRRTSGLSK